MQPRNRQNPKSRFGTWAFSATAIAGMMSPMAIVAPARAIVLNDWMFDPTSQAVSLTLPNGVTPDFFLLAEPARIILEIPNTTLGNVTASEQYSGAVRNIRLTEVAGGSRLVLELAPNTRLDPRHAELMATDLGNGQTEWVLQPLLQDTPTAPIAATPGVPNAVPPEPSEVAAPEPASPDRRVAEPAPAIAETPDPGAIAEAPAATAPELAAATASDEELTEAGAIAAEAETAAVELPVTPSPESSAEPVAAPRPASPSLPDIATSATTGAVQALPTGPDPLAGASTDAAVLAGAINDDLSDQPPAELPLDPLVTGPSSTVSVPSLAEADSTPAPAVAVPPLASVPAAPTRVAPQPNQPSPSSTASAANQVRPPGSASAPAAPPVVTNPPASRPSVAPPPTAAPVATANGIAPDQVRPPSSPSRSAESSSVATTLPPESSIRPPVAAATRPEALPAEASIRPPATTTARAEGLPAASSIRPPVATATPSETLPVESTIRPPGVETARAEGLPVESTIRPPVAETARREAPEVVAANSLAIPTLPAPPDHWREPGNRAIAPSDVRPPTGAVAPAAPTNVAPRSESVTTAAIEAPPFLTPAEAESEAATAALQERELPSIPPPPSIPQGSGPLPFGEPLPPSPSRP
jgi:hypothetical protein